jgi:hypothetical protein
MHNNSIKIQWGILSNIIAMLGKTIIYSKNLLSLSITNPLPTQPIPTIITTAIVNMTIVNLFLFRRMAATTHECTEHSNPRSQLLT